MATYLGQALGERLSGGNPAVLKSMVKAGFAGELTALSRVVIIVKMYTFAGRYKEWPSEG